MLVKRRGVLHLKDHEKFILRLPALQVIHMLEKHQKRRTSFYKFFIIKLDILANKQPLPIGEKPF